MERAGTKDAKASYQTLTDQEALDIEQRNAMADAWKKLMDDLNTKMNDTITDQVNAMLQAASIDANTDALSANTRAMLGLTEAMGGDAGNGAAANAAGTVAGKTGNAIDTAGTAAGSGEVSTVLDAATQIASSNTVTETIVDNAGKQAKAQEETNKRATASTQSAFAKMTAAANLYGVAYQAMSNDNMSAAQKFGMIAIQAAGQAAITALTVDSAKTTGEISMETPSVLAKIMSSLGPIAGPIAFAAFTGLLGGLMGLAASKIAKSKAEIAQATGVSASVSAGRLATGMLAYAAGNVNEFTDPSTLREGRTYNVDAADGKTYRARYMGRNPKTHLTNGPEFHLSGEHGREMIIDAGTTRQITMNENEIWHTIKALSGGGRITASRRRRGMAAFAEGNVSEFADYAASSDGGSFDPTALQASLDRNSAVQEALLERLSEPIVAQNILYGPDGLPNVLRKIEKQAQRHGEKYI